MHSCTDKTSWRRTTPPFISGTSVHSGEGEGGKALRPDLMKKLTAHCRYLNHRAELQPLFAMTTHDYSIKDALYDYLEVRMTSVRRWKLVLTQSGRPIPGQDGGVHHGRPWYAEGQRHLPPCDLSCLAPCTRGFPDGHRYGTALFGSIPLEPLSSLGCHWQEAGPVQWKLPIWAPISKTIDGKNSTRRWISLL